MLQSRVIPCLLLNGKSLVKTVNFKKPNYIGDALNTVRIFNEKEVDELIFLDISASKNKTGPDFELIKDIANECFIPFGYGGGIRDIDDAKKLFDIGVEKLSFNSALTSNVELVKEVVKRYGSQSVIASIDVKKDFFGRYKIYNHINKKNMKISLKDYIDTVKEIGVGEVLLTSVDKEGTMSGYDIELINQVSEMLSIPVVAHGGAKDIEDFGIVLKNTQASAVAAGSLFVYHGPYNAVLINYPMRSELENFNLIDHIE